MKTTLEIPDKIFRKAKAKAAERGIPLRQFVTEAVELQLKIQPEDERRPWMKFVGALSHLHEETMRIERIIEEEFETIDPEDWE